MARRISKVAATLPASNAPIPTNRRRSGPCSTGRTWIRIGRRVWTVGAGVWRIAYRIATTASRPGMTDSQIAPRIPTVDTSPIASSGAPIAPRLSITRSNPYAAPYRDGATTSANNAFRAGTRSPRAVQPALRSNPTCHAAVAPPVAAVSTAVLA